MQVLKVTFAVSFPTPLLAPVTMTTLLDKLGMSSTVNLDAGGNDWENIENAVLWRKDLDDLALTQ